MLGHLKILKRIFFIEWILVISFIFISINLIRYNYFYGRIEKPISKKVYAKFKDSHKRYVLQSDDKYFIEIDARTYKIINISEDYRGYWVK